MTIPQKTPLAWKTCSPPSSRLSEAALRTLFPERLYEMWSKPWRALLPRVI